MTMEQMKGETLDSCGKFIKYSIFVVNVLLFLGGLAVIALGIWALVKVAPTQKALDQHSGIAGAAILLAFGGILAFATFLGCCGAIKEVKCLLLTFFIFVLIIAILFIAAVILVYKYGDQTENLLQEAMNETLHLDESKDAWDFMQSHWKCCGVTSYKDWVSTPPESCHCDPNTPNCGNPNYWTEGCEKFLRDELKNLAKPILGVVVTIIVVLLLSLVFTCSLVLML